MPLSSSEIEALFDKALVRNPLLEFKYFAGDRQALHEMPWVEAQPFLLRRGYRLRPRFHPNWTPPWLDGTEVTPKMLATTEESLTLLNGVNLLDAIRISDGTRVVLRRVETSSNEIPVLQYLSSPDLRDDPCNRTVPVLDIIPLPDNDTHALVVMPQLILFNLLPFRRFGDVVLALRQLIEGLNFMHQHNVVHSDACYYNLMMDGTELIPRGVHFMKPRTHDGCSGVIFEWHDRGLKRQNYYFIDFELSERYPVDQKTAAVFGRYGQDRTVPEFNDPKPHDPFKVDIYQLGNVVMRLIKKEYEGLEPLLDLATAMTRAKPQDRISLQEALKELDRIPQKLYKRRIWQYDCTWSQRVDIRYCSAKPRSVYY